MKARDARVLLTGATGGIGMLAAARLAGAGASVLLTGRSPARLATLARQLHNAGGPPPDWYEAELTSIESLEQLAPAAAAWGCNVVVHAAGAPAFGAAREATPAGVHQVLATNLIAPMVLTQALLPHLQAQARAQVVFVGSVLGAIALPGYAAYCASKFGLRGYAQALRRELAGGRVRVQYLGPRSTRTAFNGAAVEAYNRATGTAMDPPEVAADALLRLIEDEAAERFLGFPERLAVRLNGAAPALLDRAFAPHRRAVAASADTPAPIVEQG